MVKAIIHKADLPGVSKDGYYTMRFRIVSDDKNSVSYWTPIYNVFVPDENGKYVKDALTVNVYHSHIVNRYHRTITFMFRGMIQTT